MFGEAAQMIPEVMGHDGRSSNTRDGRFDIDMRLTLSQAGIGSDSVARAGLLIQWWAGEQVLRFVTCPSAAH